MFSRRLQLTVAVVSYVALALWLAPIPQADAAEDFDSLYAAIVAANSGSSSSITLREDITLSAALPPITGTITIEGDGHSISGDNTYRIFDVDGGVLAIENATLTEGKAPGLTTNRREGGAIRMRNGAELIVSDSAFTNNSAYHGGVINAQYGVITILRSNFSSNRAGEEGGVIQAERVTITIGDSSFTGNRASVWGAVIYDYRGTVTVTNSSFTDNSADYAGGVMFTDNSRVRVSNSTFSSNRAAVGGAISANSSDVTLTHVTMMDNRGSHIHGDAISNTQGTVRLRNSIVAGGGPGDDCVGGLDERIGNLSQDGTCGIEASDDPLLDSLTGALAYHPLLDGSPAVDAADPAFCLETDQVGTARPQGGGCDIGAIESTTASPALPLPLPPPVCTLSDQIIAANTDRPAGDCPAGSGPDTITLTEDFTLKSALPHIHSDITIEGNGYTISGDGRFRIFSVDGGKVTINNLTLVKGKAASDMGGAIRIQGRSEAIINNATFVDNFASIGGAIGTESGSLKLTIDGSSFIGNIAISAGGAVFITGGGTANITNSSFVENTARERGGGAIDVTNAAYATVSNSTFIDNVASRGGALSSGYGQVTLTHVTMFKNRAFQGEAISTVGPFAGAAPGAFRLRNSILVGAPERFANCHGRLTQNIGNFIADGSCSPALSGDPMLEDVIDTPAFLALQAGSPAIQAGDPRFCPDTDQIGRARPLVGRCDIGAIESIPVAQDVSACTVTTTHGLNLRDGPSGNIIGAVPAKEAHAALARTPGWFQVDKDGTRGWISADYVVTEGDCG